MMSALQITQTMASISQVTNIKNAQLLNYLVCIKMKWKLNEVDYELYIIFINFWALNRVL
jgi:hypothetical protein